MMDYHLEVKDLSKTYTKSTFSLNKVSFSIPKGTIMGFVGENGAGKTTTISSILNTIKKDSGIIKVFGKEMTDKDRAIREDIGVVFDAINFPETLTVKRLSKVMEGIYNKWNQKLFLEFVNKWNIPINRDIKTFSRGMSMKLSIATALSHTPKLLVLDEATSGLDPVAREDILDTFLEFVKDKNNSILISSHIISDLEKIADYITFIHKGSVILTEKKENLVCKYGIARCKFDEFNNISKSDIISYRKKNSQIDIVIKDKDTFKRKYKNIVIDKPSIEEIMLILIKGEQL